MEDVGNKPRRSRRAFTSEFKAEIVELCRRGDRSIGQVVKGSDRDRGAGVGTAGRPRHRHTLGRVD
jgi:hypothetical protein